MFDEAIVGMKKGDHIQTIVVKSEGTLSCTGALLFDHYKDPDKIEKLVSGNSVLRLGKDIGPEGPNGDPCEYCQGDLSNPATPILYPDEETMYRRNFMTEYFYIYKNGDWYTFNHNGPKWEKELGYSLDLFWSNLYMQRPENFYATLTTDLIHQLKENILMSKWPVGTIVCAQHFENSYIPIRKGTVGKVVGVDDYMRLDVRWQNGTHYSLDPDLDSFIVINDESLEFNRKEDYQMKTSVYHNLGDGSFKKAYVGYTKSQNVKELISEFHDRPLPGTYQGDVLQDGDVIVVEEPGTFLDKGSYVYEKDGLKPTEFDQSQAEEMDGVRVLMMQPGMKACETRLVSSLKSLQNAVSDHREPSLIEYSFPYPDDCMILGNEEAKLINMPLNREMNGEVYAGPIFVVKDDKCGNLKDISDENVDYYMKHAGEPRQFNDELMEHSPYLKYFGYFD